jgi:hypothetical protein
MILMIWNEKTTEIEAYRVKKRKYGNWKGSES